MRPPSHRFFVALGALMFAMAPGCKAQEDPHEVAVRQAMSNYADLAFKSHRDAAKAVELMQSHSEGFFEVPDAQSYNRIKVQWGVARERWAQTEVFVVDGSPGEEAYPFLNLSRLDPAFIDYTTSDASAGLVNAVDQYPNLTKDLLVDIHQLNGAGDVSVGYHAIEFLLWGQDYDPDEPGKRPFTDYLTNNDGTRENQERRGLYLRLATELLIDDLKAIRDGWNSDGGEWRKAFEALSSDDQIRRVIVALARLSIDEMEDARLGEPLFLQDPQTDHAPFSDLSHEDLYADAVAVRNTYLGRYDPDLLDATEPEEGPGLHTLVAEKAPALDEQFRAELEATVAAMDALRDGPALEKALLADIGSMERAAAETALAALKKQNDTLEEISNLFGFSLEGSDDDDTGTDDTGTDDTGTDDTGTDTGTDTTVFLPEPDMG